MLALASGLCDPPACRLAEGELDRRKARQEGERSGPSAGGEIGRSDEGAKEMGAACPRSGVRGAPAPDFMILGFLGFPRRDSALDLKLFSLPCAPEGCSLDMPYPAPHELVAALKFTVYKESDKCQVSAEFYADKCQVNAAGKRSAYSDKRQVFIANKARFYSDKRQVSDINYTISRCILVIIMC